MPQPQTETRAIRFAARQHQPIKRQPGRPFRGGMQNDWHTICHHSVCVSRNAVLFACMAVAGLTSSIAAPSHPSGAQPALRTASDTLVRCSSRARSSIVRQLSTSHHSCCSIRGCPSFWRTRCELSLLPLGVPLPAVDVVPRPHYLCPLAFAMTFIPGLHRSSPSTKECCALATCITSQPSCS